MIPGLTQSLASGERNEAIQKCRRWKDWIATPPAEARNDVVRKHLIRFAILTVMIAFGAGAAHASSKPETLASNGAWSGYTFTENKQKVCYMTGSPQKSEGDYTKRGDVFLFITHYPGSNVFDDLYFDMGYPVKKDAEATVAVGKTSFSLVGDKTHVFSPDRKQDKKIISAMKQGDSLVVKSTSQKGTKSVDTFDLKGFVKTYQAISKACKKP